MPTYSNYLKYENIDGRRYTVFITATTMMAGGSGDGNGDGDGNGNDGDGTRDEWNTENEIP